MDAAIITTAIVMGFTGSLHCAGMCGPIVWVMPFQAFHGVKKAAALALYHTARISVYAGMAVVLHSFRSLFDPKIQQYISIGLGSILLFTGLLSFFPGRSHISLPWTSQIQKQLSKVIGKPGLAAITFAGILNGLLPCGLVYMALSASMVMPTATDAAAMVYLFGIGTLPMLISITILKKRISIWGGPNIKRFVPVIVFCFGCLFVLRGLNLGIPYISPKVNMGHNGIQSCCHCHK